MIKVESVNSSETAPKILKSEKLQLYVLEYRFDSLLDVQNLTEIEKDHKVIYRNVIAAGFQKANFIGSLLGTGSCVCSSISAEPYQLFVEAGLLNHLELYHYQATETYKIPIFCVDDYSNRGLVLLLASSMTAACQLLEDREFFESRPKSVSIYEGTFAYTSLSFVDCLTSAAS